MQEESECGEELGGDLTQQADDDVLEVELSPDEKGDEVIEIVLEDAAGEESWQPDAAQELPPVEKEMIELAGAERLEAMCAYTKQPFLLLVKGGEGDGYEIIGTEPLPPGTLLGQPPGTGRVLHGKFYLSRYEGCPYCGAGGLILCQVCGVVSCGATDKKTGQFLPCPACGHAGSVGQSKEGWSVSAISKGSKQGKSKGR
jgi:hypothetical protein